MYTTPSDVALGFLKMRMFVGIILFSSLFGGIYEFRKLKGFLTGKSGDLSFFKKLYYFLTIVSYPFAVIFLVYSYPSLEFLYRSDAKQSVINVFSYEYKVRENLEESQFFSKFPELSKTTEDKVNKLNFDKILEEKNIVNFDKENIVEVAKIFKLFAKEVRKIKFHNLSFPQKIPPNIDLLAKQSSSHTMYQYSKIFSVLAKYLVLNKKYHSAMNVIKISALLGLLQIDGKPVNISYFINNTLIEDVLYHIGKLLIAFSEEIPLSKIKINKTIDFFQSIVKMYPRKGDYNRVLLRGMSNPKFIPVEYYRKEFAKFVKEFYSSDFSKINGSYASTYKTVEKISRRIDKKIESPELSLKTILSLLHKPNKLYADFSILVMGLTYDKISHISYFKRRQYFLGSLVPVAIYNYKRELKKYPENLSKLEEWLGHKLPPDQFSGKALYYNSEPLTLTSVGPDLKLNTKDDISLIPLYKKK